MRNRESNRLLFTWKAGFGPILLATICCLIYLVSFAHVGQAANETTVGSQTQPQAAAVAVKAQLSPEERIEHIEKTLQSVKATVEKSEPRSYENKMMSRELIRYVKVITIILVVATAGFPLTIWLLSKRRILGLSGLSGEVAATLLVVEERQAKLANILKDIQGEIDYLHSMSVPDLKNLIEQAEKYLKQNEQDLEKAGLAKEKSKH